MQVSFFGPVASIEYIKTGKFRALAVTSGKRIEALPDVPTVGEHLPGFESFSWFGVGAPRGTPGELSRLAQPSLAAIQRCGMDVAEIAGPACL